MNKAEHDQLAALADAWRMEAKEAQRVTGLDTRVKTEAIEGCAEALSDFVRNAQVDPVKDAAEVEAPKAKASVGDISAEQAKHVRGPAADEDEDDEPVKRAANHNKKR